MSVERTGFRGRPAMAALLLTLAANAALAASAPAPLALAAGARVGVVSLLDAEVTHYHSAARVQDSYLKTQAVPWSVSAMLLEAVREPLTRLGLAPVPLAPGDTLSRARESCFLDANLQKGLPKDCLAAYARLAADEQLAALVVLGPGLNDADHAQGTRRKDLPEYLRGWCVVSGSAEGGPAPLLLNLTELLLISVTPKGAQLEARAWGGTFTRNWTGFVAPADPHALPAPLLEQLQPLFAGLLQQQTQGLLFGRIVPAH
ncbi:MAG TPA: hypothetical protein VLV29_09785 [Steroidobacteraceae bacterium]|nr:hypothetical protein [Steroidobacteraceae bacterium]